MAASSTIVLVIDRLGAGYLGPYGNTWLETPGFNRLASTAVLCEQMLTHSPDLAEVYRAYWQSGATLEPSLPQLARQAGCRTVLVTDDEALAQFVAAADFDELHLVEPPPESAERTTPAEDAADTTFIRLIETAAALLETWRHADQPQLLWIHARAMDGPWDAPLEMREQFADEDDPPPAAGIEPPNEMLANNYDPDQVLSIAHAYAAQVAVVDLGLQALLAAIDELPQRDSLTLAVTSPRGYPLGEHLRIGPCDSALYGELLHVPCLIRFPAGEGALARTQTLMQPADLFATLAAANGWAGEEKIVEQSLLRIVRGDESSRRSIAVATAADQRMLRTTAWQLRIVKDEAGDRYELYAKPDDRWEFNDVASRAPDIVKQLLEQADTRTLHELPEELTSPWR